MTQGMTAEKILFLKDFLLNPAKIGSITPSSSYLTEKLLASLPWERFKVIVELGAGTGVFTEYAAAHKRPDSVFLVIEQDPQMQKALKARFPQVLFGSHAEDLPALMRLHNLPKADCIISGLPFAVIEKKDRLKILAGIDRSLSSHGKFVAFQYSLQMYCTFHRIFRKVKLGFTPLNLPPAFTYTCCK